MRKGFFYIFIALISVGVILLNTVDSVKYLTCEEPENVDIEVMSISNDEIVFEITKDTDNETFSDYVYHIEGKTLYIGVKYTLNPLNDDPISSFTVELDTTELIEVIIIKGGMDEVQVYPE